MPASISAFSSALHCRRDKYVRFSERLIRGVARRLVQWLGVSAHLVGYWFLRSTEIPVVDRTVLARARDCEFELPLNVPDRGLLSHDARHCGISFFDVPDRTVRETYAAEIHSCRVLVQPDEWGDLFYAVVNPRSEVVNVRGTEYHPDVHRQLLQQRESAAVQYVPHAIWVLELWDHNYAHWILWHLPKLQMIRQLGLQGPVLIPALSPILPVVNRSLEILGFTPADVRRVESGVIEVGSMTVFGMDDYDPALLQQLRRAFNVPEQASRRRVFVSRRKASRRRIVNEEHVWRVLEPWGYECFVMEDLSFDGQLELMGGVVSFVAMHGAGLANIVFAPAGAHVVELSDSSFPSPMFYATATAVGHKYWLASAAPVGVPNPGYHDLVVDISALEQVIRDVEAALETT